MEDIKAKKVKSINEKTLIVAMDIGKGVHHAYFRAPNGREMRTFPFSNSRESFESMWARICQFKTLHGLDEVVVGFESTGSYAEPMCHFLSKKPVRLVQINPMHTKRLKELTGNSPNKSDQKDPRVIADIISLGHALSLVVPEGPAAQLRRLTQARERAMKRRTALSNQLQHLIFLIFPEFLNLMKDISCKTAIYLIKTYPTPESMIGLGLEGLAMQLKRVSRGKVGREKAEALLRAAEHSIGIKEGRQSLLLEIEYVVSQLGADTQFILSLEKQMEHFLEQTPWSRSLLSIKGIGRVTVAGLIGEVGDFKKFHTVSEVMKLAGLDLYEISSGRHKGQRRISKRGRSLMRKLLFFGAINAVKSKGILNKPYHEMLDRGMPKIKALVAMARKLLRVIFALARDGSVYMENHGYQEPLKLAA
jgi:transposase